MSMEHRTRAEDIADCFKGPLEQKKKRKKEKGKSKVNGHFKALLTKDKRKTVECFKTLFTKMLERLVTALKDYLLRVKKFSDCSRVMLTKDKTG